LRDDLLADRLDRVDPDVHRHSGGLTRPCVWLTRRGGFARRRDHGPRAAAWIRIPPLRLSLRKSPGAAAAHVRRSSGPEVPAPANMPAASTRIWARRNMPRPEARVILQYTSAPVPNEVVPSIHSAPTLLSPSCDQVRSDMFGSAQNMSGPLPSVRHRMLCDNELRHRSRWRAGCLLATRRGVAGHVARTGCAATPMIGGSHEVTKRNRRQVGARSTGGRTDSRGCAVCARTDGGCGRGGGGLEGMRGRGVPGLQQVSHEREWMVRAQAM